MKQGLLEEFIKEFKSLAPVEAAKAFETIRQEAKVKLSKEAEEMACVAKELQEFVKVHLTA